MLNFCFYNHNWSPFDFKHIVNVFTCKLTRTSLSTEIKLRSEICSFYDQKDIHQMKNSLNRLLPKNWMTFLQCSENKAELFHYLSNFVCKGNTRQSGSANSKWDCSYNRAGLEIQYRLWCHEIWRKLMKRYLLR